MGDELLFEKLFGGDDVCVLSLVIPNSFRDLDFWLREFGP